MTGGLLREDPTTETGAIADARRFGWSEAEIAEVRRHLAAADTASEGVWPQNVAAVESFLVVATQWRTALLPSRAGICLMWIGLDYAAARAGLEGAGISMSTELWSALRELELAARAALNGEP